MRLLNITNGFLETKNIEDVKEKYIAISHRWLPNEIELLELGLVGISKNINIGNKLYNHLIEKTKKMEVPSRNIKLSLKNKIYSEFKKWNEYLNFFNNDKDINKKNLNNHYKLIKIINCILENEDYKDYVYIWIDTLCIDKSSSAELNENIVSMYKIYRYAFKVIVLLCDNYKGNIKNMIKDEWWNRIWTLQEYLANNNICFYDNNTEIEYTKLHIFKYLLNNKEKNEVNINEFINIITIDHRIIKNNSITGAKKVNEEFVKSIPAGIKFNWIFERKFTREEDIAYSLMGLLDTYITPLYGEGIDKSLKRLIREYILQSNDTSIFDIINSSYISFLPNFSYINKLNPYSHQIFNIPFLNKNISTIGQNSLRFIKYEDYDVTNFKEYNIINNHLKITTDIMNIKSLKFNNNEIFKEWIKIRPGVCCNSINIIINNINGGIIGSDLDNIYIEKNFKNYYIIIYSLKNKMLCKKIEDNIFIRVGKFIDNYDLNTNFDEKLNIKKIYNSITETIYIK
jgi:hypothetical protein